MKLKNNVKYKLFIHTDVSLKDTKLETPPKSIVELATPGILHLQKQAGGEFQEEFSILDK
jgi:hypothetical protein